MKYETTKLEHAVLDISHVNQRILIYKKKALLVDNVQYVQYILYSPNLGLCPKLCLKPLYAKSVLNL